MKDTTSDCAYYAFILSKGWMHENYGRACLSLLVCECADFDLVVPALFDSLVSPVGLMLYLSLPSFLSSVADMADNLHMYLLWMCGTAAT